MDSSVRMVAFPLPTEIISDDGEFREKDFGDFMKLRDGVPYTVITIMGPQSSGKSTLLNHLFQTEFKVMDETKGRYQTTKGVWVARARNIDRFSIIMDVEGTDSQERGEDGPKFEKQSALLALAVADIFLINMWYTDIGLEKASNRPLLKTIFEEIMHIISSPRRRTLYFVIRDTKKETQVESVEARLREDVQKIWEMVPKTEKFKDTPLGDFFNVEVKALPDYDYKQERFKEEVSQLKERILDSITVGGDRGCVVPASGFGLYVKKLWETIKQNKNLDLPTHKKMVAMVRCEEIATQKLTLFKSDEVVNPACVNTLNHLRSEILRKFKTVLEERLSKGEGYGESVRICRQSCETEFDQHCSDVATEQAEWHALFVRKELVPYMEIHALHLRTTMLPQVVEKHREQLATTINRHLLHLFNKLELDEDKLSWGHIRSFLKRETDWAVEDFRDEVSAFELEETTLQRKVDELKVYARRSVENKFKEQAQFIMQLLYTRYICPSMSEDEDRFLKCLKLMSIMAAIRLEESSRDDEVENLLVSVLINGGDEVPANDPLASRTWEELDIQIPREMTLITPLGCKDIWPVFKKDIETEHKKIETAHIMKIETAHKQSHESKSLEGDEEFMSLPLWAKLGALLLGPNKFVLLLRDSRFDLAIKLAGTGIELAGCLADQVYKSMNTTHCKIMNKLKAIIGKFYDFMAAMFAMNLQLNLDVKIL